MQVESTGLVLSKNGAVPASQLQHLQGELRCPSPDLREELQFEKLLLAGCMPGAHYRVCHAASNSRKVFSNLPYEQMHAPIVGPANPYTKDGLATGSRNHMTGHVEVRPRCSLEMWLSPFHKIRCCGETTCSGSGVSTQQMTSLCEYRCDHSGSQGSLFCCVP